MATKTKLSMAQDLYNTLMIAYGRSVTYTGRKGPAVIDDPDIDNNEYYVLVNKKEAYRARCIFECLRAARAYRWRAPTCTTEIRRASDKKLLAYSRPSGSKAILFMPPLPEEEKEEN